MRYWYHPESDSAFESSDDGPDILTWEQTCLEMNEAEYRSVVIRFDAENDQFEHYWRSEMFEDILG